MKPYPPHTGWYCAECDKNTHIDPKDYYMLTFELWDAIGVGDGMLCMDCVETKLGRKLQAKDILDCPLNHNMNPYTMEILNGEDRTDRLSGQPLDPQN